MNYSIFKGRDKQADIWITDDMAGFAIENEEGNKLLKECFRLLKEFMDKYGGLPENV